MTVAHQVPGKSFDEQRLEDRRKTLGASEIPAVAGVNPHRSALDVYLEKKGLAEPFAGNAFTEWGLRMEEPIAQKYAEVTGLPVVTSDTIVARGWMSATPDRLVVQSLKHLNDDEQYQPLHGVEIKRFGEYRADDFGVPGTGEVPLDVTAQALWSMMVTDLKRWDIAVLIGQADFRIYRIEYDDAAANALHDLGYNFWHNHVLAGVEPALDLGTSSAQRYLQQKFALHSAEMLDPTPEIVEAGRELARIKAEMKALDAVKGQLEHRIQSAIGTAAGIRNVATWKLDKSGRPLWKGIAEALGATKPENSSLVQQHTSPPGRRFRLLIGED
jgi:putative phage-type endonuclease